MSTFPKIATLLASIWISSLAYSDIVYNVTFEDPPHPVGSSPVTSFGGSYVSDRPYDQSGFTVSGGVAGFGSQSAVVTASGYQYISLFSGNNYSTGIHSISWDWALLTADAGQQLQASFDIQTTFGASSALLVRYGLDQSIVISDPVSGLITVGSYVVGQVYTFTALLNLEADTYDFAIDGNTILSSRPMEIDDALNAAAVIRPLGNSEFAVDNLRWEVVPEPSTIALLALAVVGLAIRARYSRPSAS